MKKIYRIVCLIMTVILTGYLFVCISYMHRGYTRLMGFYGLEDNTADVVFIGTSVTFSSFMPMEAWNEYGMAAYDYCTNVQFENSLRHSVKEVMKTQTPQLLMIDIAPFLRNHRAGRYPEYIDYNIDSMKYSLNRLALVYEINQEIEGDFFSFLNYYFDINRYHTNTASVKQLNNSCNDVNRGYGYLEKNGGAALDTLSLVQDDGSEVPLEGYDETYFRELLKELGELDCDVVFYCGPVLFVMVEEYGHKNYIKRVVEESGYVFWDFSTELDQVGLDYENDFWSHDHFDSLGAEKVTKYLAEKILASYDIPDRRNDERYEGWHEDYLQWITLKAEYNGQDHSL